jgi:hypothetical protein
VPGNPPSDNRLDFDLAVFANGGILVTSPGHRLCNHLIISCVVQTERVAPDLMSNMTVDLFWFILKPPSNGRWVKWRPGQLIFQTAMGGSSCCFYVFLFQ